MFRKLYEVIFERELELRERLFRIILLIGAIANVLSLAEVVLLKNPLSAAVPLLVLFGVIVFAIMATFKYRRIKLQVFVM